MGRGWAGPPQVPTWIPGCGPSASASRFDSVPPLVMKPTASRWPSNEPSMRTASFSRRSAPGIHVARPLDEEGSGGQGAYLFGDRVRRADVADAEIAFDGVGVLARDRASTSARTSGLRRAVLGEVQRRRHGDRMPFLGSIELSGHRKPPSAQAGRRLRPATSALPLTLWQAAIRCEATRVHCRSGIQGSRESGAAGCEIAAAGA